MNLKELVGSGDKIGLFAAPFIVTGIALNIIFPSFFSVGGPPFILAVVSIVILVPGVINWLWSVVLILTKVSRNELITYGPYAVVRHPLYTGVAFLVLPWIGFLCDSWTGALMGIVLYIGSRLYSPEEEKKLAKTYGTKWDEYCKKVLIPWL